MEKNKLDELAVDLSEKYGVSIEEAMEAIQKAAMAFVELEKVFKLAWESVKEAVLRLYKQIDGFQIEYNGSNARWPVVWDSRRKSQVLLNKPKFMVRKVIR